MSYLLSTLLLIWIAWILWGLAVNLILPRLNPNWVDSADRKTFLALFETDKDCEVDWYEKRPGEQAHLPIKKGSWRPKEFAFANARATPPAEFESIASRILASASAGFRMRKLWHRAYVGVCVVPTVVTLRPKTWWFHRGIPDIKIPQLGYDRTLSSDEIALVSKGKAKRLYRVVCRGMSQ